MARTRTRMSRSIWSWARLVGSAVILAVLVWRLGTGPFLAGLKAVDGLALVAASAIFFLTTVCGAWRWAIVSRGLGVRLSLPAAVAAYYRAVFLNLMLPGGVAGDVHRGVTHGREVHDVGRALRAVVWERAAGQVVQAVLAISLLLMLPSPVRSSMPFVAVAAVAVVLGVVLLGRVRGRGGRSRWTRIRNAVVADVRNGVLRRKALPAVIFASALVFIGHAATFLVAARAAGVDAPVSRLLPLAMVALLAMVLPSIAGWGPREGVTAWVFSAAGLGAERGAATAVAYGVMVLAASLPGAIVLVLGWRPYRRVSRTRSRRRVVFRPEGAADA
jgi:glycosyltransferase 2 family protein